MTDDDADPLDRYHVSMDGDTVVVDNVPYNYEQLGAFYGSVVRVCCLLTGFSCRIWHG